MKIWLDDIRIPREHLPALHQDRDWSAAALAEWTWVLTAPEAIALLEAGGVDEISLDHDLGLGLEMGTGYQVATWLEERVFTDEAYVPPTIHVHSSNPNGHERILLAMDQIQKQLVLRGIDSERVGSSLFVR